MLVTFSVDNDSTSIAGRVVEQVHEGHLAVEFVHHDWERLQAFAEDAAPESSGPPSRQSEPESIAPPPDAHVLVVQDDPDIARCLTRMLESNGYRATAASSPEQALATLEEQDIHLVLWDWGLAGMCGAEFCETLRRPGRQPAVVFLACQCSADDRRRALNAGADDFVSMPFRWRELQTRLVSVLRRSGVRDAG